MCNNLESIVMPAITYLGSGNFFGCNLLSSVTFGTAFEEKTEIVFGYASFEGDSNYQEKNRVPITVHVNPTNPPDPGPYDIEYFEGITLADVLFDAAGWTWVNEFTLIYAGDGQTFLADYDGTGGYTPGMI